MISRVSVLRLWSSHHLGSLTSRWRGQRGPGEPLFHLITRPLLESEGWRRRARGWRRRRRETQERSTERLRGNRAPIWFSVSGEGREDTRETALLKRVLPIIRAHVRHGSVETDGAHSGHLCLSFAARLRVRGNYEPWQGPVATKRMPHHMPVCYSWNLLCPFTPRACWTDWEPYVEKLRRWSVTAAGK